MEPEKRVLIVHNYYRIPGGEDTVAENEMRLLEAHGWKVFRYFRNNTELDRMLPLKKLLLPLVTVFNPKTAVEVARIIRKEKINIVHVHNTLPLISPAVYYAALCCGVPVVQTIHNFRLLCPGAALYRDHRICEDCISGGLIQAVKHGCYRNSRIQTIVCVIAMKIHRMTGIYGKISYICLTAFNRKMLLKYRGIRPESVYVKPNFTTSEEEFCPASEREDYFVYAGRLDRLKGIDVLLKAWKRMGEKAPELIICGTGPMEDWCRKYILEHKLHAEMRGQVPNAEVKKLLAGGRALLLPTQWYEGFPMTIIEAYSVGTPVLCTNIGNAGSVVLDGVTGFKFRTQDGLIEGVNKILEHPELCQYTADHFLNNYTAEDNYRMLDQIYDKVTMKK